MKMVCMLIILRSQHADPPKGKKVKNQNLMCPGEAKAQIAAPAARGVVVTTSRPAVPRAVAPTAAAIHPVRANRRPFRICNMAGWIIPIPVLTPLPHIAMHVVKPPGIWRKTRHFYGVFSISSFGTTRHHYFAQEADRLIFAGALD